MNADRTESIPPRLRLYIEREIIPRYATFDRAHSTAHVRHVIDESLALACEYGADAAMAYTIAAYHDIGMPFGRKEHHLHSAAILRADNSLRQWFSPEQIETMAEAVEDHRASSTAAPRTLYGAIVAEADRELSPETVVRRTLQYGLDHYPEETGFDFHYCRTLEHLTNKYAEGGYMHLTLSSPRNIADLARLRALLSDSTALMSLCRSIWAEETSRI